VANYLTSTGERWSQDKLDREIRKAKAIKKQQFYDDHGYYFCEDCGKNENTGYIDMSHDISVQRCKDNGRADDAADPDNLTLRCRSCHRKYDNM